MFVQWNLTPVRTHTSVCGGGEHPGSMTFQGTFVKLSRAAPGHCLDGRPGGKNRTPGWMQWLERLREQIGSLASVSVPWSYIPSLASYHILVKVVSGREQSGLPERTVWIYETSSREHVSISIA